MCLIKRKLLSLYLHSKFKVRRSSSEAISRGSIILANHTANVDELFISNNLPSKTIFVNYNNSHHKYSKHFNYIDYPKSSNEIAIFNESLKQYLENGINICFFPERYITKDGLLGEFYDDLAVVHNIKNYPVYCMYLGPLWGTKYSYRTVNKVTRPKLINIFSSRRITDFSAYNIKLQISLLATESEKLPRLNEKPIHYRFISNTKNKPFKANFIDYDEKPLKNLELLTRSLILTLRLKKYIKKDTNTGILLPNCNATVTSILSVLNIGSTPALLNFSLSKKVYDECIEKGNIDRIITSKKFIRKLDFEPNKKMIFLEDIAKKVSSNWKLIYFFMALLLPRFVIRRMLIEKPANLDDTAIILFSSGSSGIPKAVELTHHNLNSDVEAVLNYANCSPVKDSITGNLPMFHSFGVNVCFWIPIMYGIKIVYIKSPIDSLAVADAIEKYKLTLLTSTPSFLSNYIRKGNENTFNSISLLILGGEKMNQAHLPFFKKSCKIEPVEGFGCTELSPIVSVNFAEDFKKSKTTIGCEGSIGKALPGITAKIVDVETMEPLPYGEEGLLLINSPTVMKGYYNDIENTNNAIVDGWYNTNDMATIDKKGYIKITGRLARFSKVAGEMVSHELVEGLLRDFAGDLDASIVVTGKQDPKRGERLIVLYTAHSLDISKLREKLSKAGLSNLWIPKKNDFYRVDIIPMLGSGKLNLAELNKIADNIDYSADHFKFY